MTCTQKEGFPEEQGGWWTKVGLAIPEMKCISWVVMLDVEEEGQGAKPPKCVHMGWEWQMHDCEDKDKDEGCLG